MVFLDPWCPGGCGQRTMHCRCAAIRQEKADRARQEHLAIDRERRIAAALELAPELRPLVYPAKPREKSAAELQHDALKEYVRTGKHPFPHGMFVPPDESRPPDPEPESPRVIDYTRVL